MKNIVVGSALVLGANAALAGELSPIAGDDLREVRTSAPYTGASTLSGTNDVAHLSDGVSFTSWVGDAKEPVVIDFAFTGTRYIGGLAIVPGCAGSNRTFAEFARPATLVIEGGERRIELKIADRRRLQELTFDPPIAGRSVRITVGETTPGRNAGVCISDLELRELTALSALSDTKREALEANVAAFADPSKADAAVSAVVALGPAALPRLSAALQSADLAVQVRVLSAIERLGSPLGAEPLLRFWSDGPNAELRGPTLRALAKCGDDGALPVLATTLSDPDLALADAAARSIGQFGAAAVPLLAAVLPSKHEDVQVRTLRALGDTRDARALALAIPYLSAQRSTVRAAAARAIAGSGQPEALPHLRHLTTDPHPTVRVTVAKALRDMAGDEATALLAGLMRDPDELVARVALNRMARRKGGDRQLAIYLGEPRVPLGDIAIALLSDTKTPGALRLMVDALRRGEQRYRQALRQGILHFGRPGIVAILDGGLEDERLHVDAEVILGEAGVVALPLLAAALTARADEPPMFVVRALGRIGSEEALPALEIAERSGLLAVRIEVVKALGGMPAAAVQAPILAALASPDVAIRAEAAMAAGKAGVSDAVPALIAALSDHTIPAEGVVTALAALGDASAESAMLKAFWRQDAKMEVRLAVLHACRRIQSPACEDLIARAGSHPNPDLRAIALRLIAVR